MSVGHLLGHVLDRVLHHIIIGLMTTALQIAPITGYFLWYGYHDYTNIKDLTFSVYNLGKYTWKVMVCIGLTRKKHLELNI